MEWEIVNYRRLCPWNCWSAFVLLRARLVSVPARVVHLQKCKKQLMASYADLKNYSEKLKKINDLLPPNLHYLVEFLRRHSSKFQLRKRLCQDQFQLSFCFPSRAPFCIQISEPNAEEFVMLVHQTFLFYFLYSLHAIIFNNKASLKLCYRIKI